MSYTVTAILAAMIIWWFSTGIILVFVRLAEKSGRLGGTAASLVALPSLLIGGWLYLNSLSDASVGGAYAGFMAALFMWGWIELALLTNTITGPMPRPCPPDVAGFERFIWSWGAIAYHELALVLMLSFAVIAGLGAENTVGLWTVVTLYAARVSAKLNLFLGVPYINTELLPENLRYLASHFRRAKMNGFFPVSALALGAALAFWVTRLAGAIDGAAQAGYALLATLTALALLEHLLMILSLQDAKLWNWMLPKAGPLEGPYDGGAKTTTNLKGGKNGI